MNLLVISVALGVQISVLRGDMDSYQLSELRYCSHGAMREVPLSVFDIEAGRGLLAVIVDYIFWCIFDGVRSC